MSQSFSQSQLSTAYRCNRLYQYLYVDKLESQAPKSADMLFGTAMHMALDTLFSGQGDFIEDFKLFWGIEKEKANRYGRYSHEALEEQGVVLLNRFERLHAKKIKINQMEQRLLGSIGDISIEGTPDIVGWYDGVSSIIDFKTSGTKYPKDKVQVSEQMYLYAYLSQTQAIPAPVEQLVYIVFVKGKEPSIQTLKYSFTQDELNAAIKNVQVQCEDLLIKKQYSQNRANCLQGENRCDFFSLCHPEKTLASVT